MILKKQGNHSLNFMTNKKRSLNKLTEAKETSIYDDAFQKVVTILVLFDPLPNFQRLLQLAY
ncbi:hypothetical protein MHYMCMPSP_00411 [Hyalomma marginatum]|nr:hypothetical protein MHYMCMPSP_00411 [Hyalomma marginatum]